MKWLLILLTVGSLAGCVSWTEVREVNLAIGACEPNGGLSRVSSAFAKDTIVRCKNGAEFTIAWIDSEYVITGAMN